MPKSTTNNICIRMDSNLNTAAKAPNKETVSAMLEAERIPKAPNLNGYHNINELFADLDA